MVDPLLRTALCSVVGVLAGVSLASFLAPDPTGLLAAALVIVVAVTVAGVLHRSTWLRTDE